MSNKKKLFLYIDRSIEINMMIFFFFYLCFELFFSAERLRIF